MRLWHHLLIPHLDDQRLLGQHRECCALRGNGWGKKHSTVDYVFTHPPNRLYFYHCKVMREMQRRGMEPGLEWFHYLYRGKGCQPWVFYDHKFEPYDYDEHGQAYMEECLENLREKGALRESRLYYRLGDGKAFRKELLG